ncbi:DUF927 domain-containing protein [Anoxybacillus sp. MB8]|uniref:DUF927 domain-containing protein n=1 Tax=Anoxybacillus sp. MB8 TaxID=2496850 RepID=UPI0013D3588A|nr:DUF927 domain-containing protein [Anoxybacillus sp. MB8]
MSNSQVPNGKNQVLKGKNKAKQGNTQVSQVSNQVPQVSNQVPQVSNQVSQVSNQVPQVNSQAQSHAMKNVQYYGAKKEWALTPNLLYKKDEDKYGNVRWQRVSNYMEITQVHQNLENQDVTLTLRYRYLGEYKEIQIKREQLNPNEFMKLSGKGVDAFHYNVKNLIEFLVTQEKEAPYEYVHCGMGWSQINNQINNQLCFKHYRIIGLPSLQSTYKGTYCIEPKGTLKDWIKIIRSEVIGNVYLELALVFGFSAAVIGLLSTQSRDMDTLLVHIYGNSSKGKTTAAQVAVSPFGKPSRHGNGLIKSWSATHNAIIALLRDNYGVPIALDEASMSTVKDFSPLIYMFAENREKERLTKEGQLREQHKWATTIISTAEHSLFQKTNKNDGLRMRAFEFGNITWTTSAGNADALKKGLSEHYGHAGIRFVKHLLRLGLDEVMKRCEKWKAHCENHLPKSEFVSRVAQKFGILLATAEMVKEAFKLPLNMDEMMRVLHDVEEQAAMERGIAEQAYEYVTQRILQHLKCFRMDKKPFDGYECWGKISYPKYAQDGQVEVAIFPHKFKQLLEEGGFSDPKTVLEEWRQKGYLKSEKGKFVNRRKVLDENEMELRKKSGLKQQAGSKGADMVYVIVMDSFEEFGLSEPKDSSDIKKIGKRIRESEDLVEVETIEELEL